MLSKVEGPFLCYRWRPVSVSYTKYMQLHVNIFFRVVELMYPQEQQLLRNTFPALTEWSG